ncbi:MAG TPA: hypothetical protein ENF77_00160 [Candidatus Acetothermia bacterium]|nr:hypothetical protein [Candidatus Acetothermia bacterium]
MQVPVLGSPDAPVAIPKFSDLSCPFCARFALDVLPKRRGVFIEAGWCDPTSFPSRPRGGGAPGGRPLRRPTPGGSSSGFGTHPTGIERVRSARGRFGSRSPADWGRGHGLYARAPSFHQSPSLPPCQKKVSP